MNKFLGQINSPKDLKNIDIKDLANLAKEIRSLIIDTVSKTGGHLASSLGAVDLVVALHYLLNTPQDKIIWDVGHQAYAHKIITGRAKKFSTLRQEGGISGFPNYKESVYDSFTTGHASNSISLALGLSAARDFNKTKEKIVAVIGDGSLTGGICFEGLNNAGHLKKDLIVILNTNEMSISPSVGAIPNYINKIISLPIYNRFHESLENFVKNRLPKGSRILKLVNKFEEGLKGLFIPGILFEELGFRYFGPFDGHNIELLIKTFKNIFRLPGPLILHVVTKKGKGYGFAENSSDKFHSALPFEIETGEFKKNSVETYTQIFGNKITQLAKNDNKIVAITAAMAEGTGLDKFQNNFPERFFDVGIAEEHAVAFSSGLAKGGLKPVVAIYSTFLQRAYDQIVQDIALNDSDVVFILDRAGLVGSDGPTHHGLFDIAYLRHIPNLVVMAPADKEDLELMLEFAVKIQRPVAIRFPKAEASAVIKHKPIKLGEPEILSCGKDVLIIAFGSMVINATLAENLLLKKGINCTLVNARFATNLNSGMIKELAASHEHIFTVEEGVLEGGFGSYIQEILEKPVKRFGLPSEFIPHGPREVLLDKYGLSPNKIAEKIIKCLK